MATGVMFVVGVVILSLAGAARVPIKGSRVVRAAGISCSDISIDGLTRYGGYPSYYYLGVKVGFGGFESLSASASFDSSTGKLTIDGVVVEVYLSLATGYLVPIQALSFDTGKSSFKFIDLTPADKEEIRVTLKCSGSRPKSIIKKYIYSPPSTFVEEIKE